MTQTDKPGERATLRDWEQIRDSYIRGEGSLRRLAQRHVLPLSTVEARCRREGWVRLREKRSEAALEKVVGTAPGHVVAEPVQSRDWWTQRDQEHLLENIEATRRLRQAVERKIPEASPTELERLGGALEAVVSAERLLLELTPRSARNKAPSLRPREYGNGIDWLDVKPLGPAEVGVDTESAPT